MADDSGQIDQSEIEELLKQAQGGAQTPAPSKPSELAESTIGQNEIDQLLKGAAADTSKASTESPAASSERQADEPSASVATAPRPRPKPPAASSPSSAIGDDIQYLIDQANEAEASADHPSEAPPGLAGFQFRELGGSAPSSDRATLDLLRDVELDLKIELGRTHMHLEEVLGLETGSVVALDKLAGDPVDVYVNGRLIARGEVLVLNDNFCVRVAELISGDDA